MGCALKDRTCLSVMVGGEDILFRGGHSNSAGKSGLSFGLACLSLKTAVIDLRDGVLLSSQSSSC